MSTDAESAGIPSLSVDDRWARVIGITAFGLAIPPAFDLFGPIAFGTSRFVLGQALFFALSFAIWHGNRFLLFRTATRFDWLERPWSRLLRLVGGIVLFTAPLTWVVISGWFRFIREVEAPPGTLVGVTLMNVICVVFVAHAYETVLLLKARESDALRLARAERARAEHELLALRRQVDPHFLFNSLNTLSALVDDDPLAARRYTEGLAAMLRYLLDTGDRHLVPVGDELAFLARWVELMRIRFGDAFRCEVTGAPAPDTSVPPTALQLLVENALAHNRLSAREPLEVRVQLGPQAVVVSHAHRPKPGSEGTGTGLRNLAERLRLTGAAGFEVSSGSGEFSVRVPLVRGRA